jgi:hexosaminidase
MEIVTDTLKTVLIVDGKEYQATGIYINRQTDNTLRKQGIKNATLLLPVQRIGSKTNSIVGTIDNVEVKTADPISSKDEYNKAAWTKVSVDTETNIADSKTEGLFTYAFDGKSNTIWHSNWKDGKSDKLKPQGTFDEIGGVINLGQKYTINQFSFTPRQGNASGQVTKADLYVKANEGDEWVKVAENTEFAADASKKTFYFDEQEVQFVKFVAKTSNDGWVAVSEFDVDNEKVKEMTVYAAAQKGGKVTSSAKDGKVMQHENVTVTATPNKEYKFAGWYDILTGEKVSDDAEYTFAVEMNTSLIAHFTKNGETPDPQPKEWTVTIDGTGHKVKDGETLTVEEPSKPGHAFAGFYLVGTDTAVDFTKPITSDMNVESRFTQYKVTAVESENGTITVSEMNDKGEVTVTAKANDGYIFKGWKVDGKETEALGTPYTFVPVKDTTVEAVYEKKDDTKVYHTVIINGQTVTVEDGKTLDRPADPVKEGYKFIGWFVDGKEFDFNTPITGDLKIEARFEKVETPKPGEWTVTINGQTVIVKNGDTLDRPADPVKEGYKFIGWFVDGKEFDFNTPITGDLKIEARFEKLPTTDKNDKNDKNDKVEGAVQTGDTANAVPWIVCLGAAAGAGVVVLKSRKKRS